jgi:hypothetical protein
VLVKLHLPQAKEFLQKLSAIWAESKKMFASPILDQRSLKIYQFEGVPNQWPALGCPHISGWPCPCIRITYSAHNLAPQKQLESVSSSQQNTCTIKCWTYSVLSITFAVSMILPVFSLPADLQLTYSLHATYKLNKGKLSMCTS